MIDDILIGLIIMTGFTCTSTLSTVSVGLNQNVTLPCKVKQDSQCKAEWRNHDTNHTVAKENSTNVVEGQGFEGRIHLNFTDHSLTIISTVYNDMASYECVCGKHIVDVNLKVRVSDKTTALVGADATLKCYGNTDKLTTNDDIHVRWKKDNAEVLHVKAGNKTFGSGFERRAGVSMDGYRTGDLALHISNVSLSDHGFYYCSFGDDDEPGYPRMIDFKVDKGQQPGNRATSTTATPPCEPSPNTTACVNSNIADGRAATIIVTAIVTFIVAIICYKLYLKLRLKRCSNKGPSEVNEQNTALGQLATRPHSDNEIHSELLNQTDRERGCSSSQEEDQGKQALLTNPNANVVSATVPSSPSLADECSSLCEHDSRLDEED